jgi:hypothetical protein
MWSRLVNRVNGMRAAMVAAAWLIGAAASPASAMTFSFAELQLDTCAPNCPSVIVASGEIGLDTSDEFFAFVRSQVLSRNVASMILISSPGGNVVGSLKLGAMIRTLGFSLMVGQVRGGQFFAANCFSACAYTLAGGKRRVVPDGSQVGVHAAWTRSSSMRDIVGSGTIDPRVPSDRVAVVLSRYLSTMGVSPQLVAIAETTPSSQIRVLTRAELSSLRLARASLAEPRTKRRR